MIGVHISGIYYNLLFGRSENFYPRLSLDPDLSVFRLQSLLTGDPPSILGMATDCRMPTEQEENTYEQDQVPLGCGVILNCGKCLTDIYCSWCMVLPIYSGMFVAGNQDNSHFKSAGSSNCPGA
jgi:hypothetical protein